MRLWTNYRIRLLSRSFTSAVLTGRDDVVLAGVALQADRVFGRAFDGSELLWRVRRVREDGAERSDRRQHQQQTVTGVSTDLESLICLKDVRSELP